MRDVFFWFWLYSNVFVVELEVDEKVVSDKEVNVVNIEGVKEFVVDDLDVILFDV